LLRDSFRERRGGGRYSIGWRGVRVIIAGLDQDYISKPWEPMLQLFAIAEYVTKTSRHLHEMRATGKILTTQPCIRRPRCSRRRGSYDARCRRR
jgi:thymidine kinase